MPVSICPRCKHVNPDYAIYCHFDGVVLQAHQQAAAFRLPNEFSFPSGRRCKTFDELAQGCQEEWSSARDLLMRGVFGQFFRSCNRADLVRAANDAKAQANPDIALTTFLGALPGSRTATPKLDLNPRRILLGKVQVGDVKTMPLTITNQGQGMLQGTLAVSEGQDWVSLSETKALHEVDVNAVRDQVVKLTINTKGVAAGQDYKARLTVVTNGGVVEVPLRMDLLAQPFTKAPFQGVRTQRELAEKMRSQPKSAGPVLESGEVQRWFALNGWTYPVRGAPIKGVGGVQQFFEGMGVSKPPTVSLSKNELRLTCRYKETTRAQITLQTPVKKWVYAHVTSDSPWLKITTPQVSGPQHATIPLEIDTNLWTLGPLGEGKLTVEANGGQKLTLKVVVEVQGSPAIQQGRPPSAVLAPTPIRAPAAVAAGPPPFVSTANSAPSMHVSASIEMPAGALKFVPALLTTMLLCLVFRAALIPFVDMLGRTSVANSAATKLGIEPNEASDFAQSGGWLQLPWLPILGGADAKFPAKVFQPASKAEISTLEFRHYFASYFMRWFMLRTWWIGMLLGVMLVLRRGGGSLDMPWAVIAGAFAGLIASATLAALFLVAEMLPHALWHFCMGEAHGGPGYLFLWSLFAIFSWLIVGAGLGIVLPWIGPLRRLVIDPSQRLVGKALDIVGMKTLSAYWAPN